MAEAEADDDEVDAWSYSDEFDDDVSVSDGGAVVDVDVENPQDDASVSVDQQTRSSSSAADASRTSGPTTTSDCDDENQLRLRPQTQIGDVVGPETEMSIVECDDETDADTRAAQQSTTTRSTDELVLIYCVLLEMRPIEVGVMHQYFCCILMRNCMTHQSYPSIGQAIR